MEVVAQVGRATSTVGRSRNEEGKCNSMVYNTMKDEWMKARMMASLARGPLELLCNSNDVCLNLHSNGYKGILGL